MPFRSNLKIELIDDNANNGQGEWRLIDDLVYEDRNGAVHIVPTGFTTDMASVPRAPGVYAVFGNRAHRPAVIHDYYCRTAQDKRSRSRGDELFLEAMLSVNMPFWQAWSMWSAVRGYTDQLYPEKDDSQGFEFV